MIAKKLDGQREAARLLQLLKKKVRSSKRPIILASIIVGRLFDSRLYVRLKSAAAERIGIKTIHWSLPQNTTAHQLRSLITMLNHNQTINGILLQLPLPPHLLTNQIVKTISPAKDVDGFHQRSPVTPPTIAAVWHLLRLAQPRAGAAAVILGKKSVFSRDLKSLLARHQIHATIIPAVKKIPSVTQSADIIITVLGRGPRLTATHIKPGAVIIDVGIRQRAGKTVGDVDPSAWVKAKAVSPVPGGVGPLTVAYLLYNTYSLALT